MSEIYSKKRYGDAEDDDVERCFPPDHRTSRASSQPIESQFAKDDQDNEKDLQYTPDSRQNNRDTVTRKPEGEFKKDSKSRNKAPSAASVSGTIVEITPATREVTPRAPRNTSRPGAFHDDGRNARDVIGHDDDSSATTQSHQSAYAPSDLDLVSAEAVDPDETNRIVERELAERQRKAPVAEVVEGFWCSKRVKRMSIVGGLIIVTAIVLGTVLPRVLEPPEPTPAPSAAPTAPLPYLTGFLSSISSDEGEALQTPSTPQNRALNWLVNNTFLGLYSMEKKVQRYVLATLYYSTNGNNWKRNTLWLSDDDECGWFNKATASFCVDSAVVDLDLYDDTNGNNLVGTIPNEVGLLSDSLEQLNLADNKLMGTLPSEIGALSKLNELSLWNNSISGTLPPEIGSLTSLTWVNLRVNGLEGTIVSEIGLLTNLEALSFSVNKLMGTIPSEIGLLTSLTSLFLYGNELTGTIPSEIDMLTKLDLLSLYDNAFTGDYVCPDYISVCQVSCSNNDTDECRSLLDGPVVPFSTMAPIIGSTVPLTPVPTESLPPPSTAPPTLAAFEPLTIPPSNSPTIITPTIDETLVQTNPPTISPTLRPTASPTSRPTLAPTNVQTEPPTRAPTTVCGDGIIDPGEECEADTPPFCPDGQFCDDACLCVGCGNGRVDEGEACDYSAEPNGCPDTGPLSYCQTNCICVPGYTGGGCGNGILDPGEECEPIMAQSACGDSQYCSDDCLCVGCGNGRIDDGEQCDYEAEPTGCGGDGYCTSDCECIYGTPAPGVDAYCGDGNLDEGEDCDYAAEPNGCDGNSVCNNDCLCAEADPEMPTPAPTDT